MHYSLGPSASSSSPIQNNNNNNSNSNNNNNPDHPSAPSPKTSSTYFPVLRRIQSRRKHTNDHPPSDNQQQPPRRSISQPPPIPRVVRSATDRLRSRHHQHQHHPAPPPPPLAALGSSLNNATVADLTLMTSSPQASALPLHQIPSPPPLPAPLPSLPLFSLRLVPHLDATRSLHFEPIERRIPPNTSLKIGRFTDRGNSGSNGAPRALNDCRIAFKSKVVSRGHADIFTDHSGAFFIKDTKSSSGTFLNHIRLSAPGGESRPFPLRDGDVLQLGVDYQGGTEEIYRCVKMRVEIGREWQRAANTFNQQALAQLSKLGAQGPNTLGPKSAPAGGPSGNNKTTDDPAGATTGGLKAVSDCCICLFGVTVCQALFIAPCSHTYHYKCIRPLLQMHHPGFSCPLCRTFADLEADVEMDEQQPGGSSEVEEEARVDVGEERKETLMEGQVTVVASQRELDEPSLGDTTATAGPRVRTNTNGNQECPARRSASSGSVWADQLDDARRPKASRSVGDTDGEEPLGTVTALGEGKENVPGPSPGRIPSERRVME